MPLVKEGQTRRIELEDGEWIDIHAALGLGRILAMANGGSLASLAEPTPEIVRGMLRQAIIAWSYDEPVNEENIERLELGAAMEVFSVLNETFWGDQKKGLTSSESSPPDDGPSISPTSPSSTE